MTEKFRVARKAVTELINRVGSENEYELTICYLLRGIFEALDNETDPQVWLDSLELYIS